MTGFQRAHPVRSPATRQKWAAQFERCFCCGGRQGDHWPPQLETHHIIKPGRSDEPCNFCRLCAICHMLAEGRTIREGGLLMPRLTLGMCLWLKAARDPENHNPVRLAELFHKPLPIPEPPPERFLAEYQLRSSR